MNENQPSNSFDPSRPVPPYGPSYPGRPAFDAPDGHSTPPPPFMGATPLPARLPMTGALVQDRHPHFPVRSRSSRRHLPN